VKQPSKIIPAAVLAVLFTVASLAVWGIARERGPVASGEGLRVELTPAERQWLAAHPVVRVGLLGDAGPFSFRDAENRIVGLDLDLLDQIARRTGLHFEYVTSRVWADVFAALQSRRLDAAAGIGKTADREQYLLFTEPFAFSPDAIVTRTDAPICFDVSELGGQRVAIARTSFGARREILQRAPGSSIVEYDNMSEAVHAVSRGEANAAFADAVIAAFAIKTDGLTNLRLGVVYNDRAEVYFAARSDWPELASILQKGLAGISAAERNEIKSRWLTVDYETDRWWPRAFKIAASLAGAAAIFLLLFWLHHRQLARELAERRRIQAELETAHAEVARVSQEKSELLRMVAHDLRSPLTGLLLGTDLLKANRADERLCHDTLSQMRATTQQMIRLTNDLVDVQAIEDGRRGYARVPVDFGALVQEAVGAFSEAAARKRIRLVCETGAEELSLESDPCALRQVADNLISNALKYSPAGSCVSVVLRQEENGLQLRVSDQGPGVSSEDRARIFQKYGQGSAKPTDGEKSIGLGLWIVRRVVTSLEGSIRVESEPGGGATFIVELPMRALLRA
jgi:signal transduction histidine kinase